MGAQGVPRRLRTSPPCTFRLPSEGPKEHTLIGQYIHPKPMFLMQNFILIIGGSL